MHRMAMIEVQGYKIKDEKESGINIKGWDITISLAVSYATFSFPFHSHFLLSDVLAPIKPNISENSVKN